MALYVTADLHLGNADTVDKPMEVFGRLWENHIERLVQNWCVEENDTVVIAGDISWAMDFKQLAPDFEFIDKLPGKKIILKGNHDYWWSTMSKLKEFAKNYNSISFLHNNSFEYEGIGICGTRGWITEPGQPADIKVLNREVGRLKASIASSSAAEKIVFLHYPPVFGNIECKEITSVLEENNIKKCYYGHLHGYAHRNAVHDEERNGTRYFLAAADFTGFKPIKIL